MSERRVVITSIGAITPVGKDADTFWESLKQLTEAEGTLFDLPPAKVRGNIFNVDDPEEVVLGFFEVAAVDTIRNFIIPSLIRPEVDQQFFCPEPGFPFVGFRPSECCNCTQLPGASLERPDWF